MSNEEINRKIAVIFATDLVGYSKHMEKDENATLRGLRECNKIIEPLIKHKKVEYSIQEEIPYLQNFQVLLLPLIPL